MMNVHKKLDGVGRGNGEGSISTQFQDGAPSANPNGRPRKQVSNLPPAELIARRMAKFIPVRIDNKTVKMRQFDAMLESMLNDFPNAPLYQKLQLLKFLAATIPGFMHAQPEELPAASIAEFVEAIARAHREQEAESELRKNL